MSQYMRLTDGQTDRISTARCDLTKLNAHKNVVEKSHCYQLNSADNQAAVAVAVVIAAVVVV